MILCKLNKAVLTKGLTLCPTHNMNVNMIVLVIITATAQGKEADKDAGNPADKVDS